MCFLWLRKKSYIYELKKIEIQGLFQWLEVIIPVVEQKAHIHRSEINLTSHLIKRIGRHFPAESCADWEIYLLANLLFTSRIRIPDYIFVKQEKLSPYEASAIHDHVYFALEYLDRSPIFKKVKEAFSSHHERYDGFGYPRKKSGEEIPLLARVVHVVESYISMTSSRSYRSSLAPIQALEEIKNESGARYDPQVVEALEREIRISYPDEFPIEGIKKEQIKQIS